MAGDSLYESPPPDLCRAEDSILVLVDVQERLSAAMPEPDLSRLVKNTGILLQAAEQLGIPVIVSQQYPDGLGKTIAALSSKLPPASRQIDKTCFSCISDVEFKTRLAESRRRQLVLTGLETHICVLQTAFEALADGYRVFVTEDAVCARSPERTSNGIERMRQAGASICHSESVLFEWLRDASHPDFKSISALLK